MPEDRQCDVLAMRQFITRIEREENSIDHAGIYDPHRSEMWEPEAEGWAKEPFPVVNDVDNEQFPRLEVGFGMVWLFGCLFGCLFFFFFFE